MKKITSVIITILMIISLVNCQVITSNTVNQNKQNDFKVTTTGMYPDNDGDGTEPLEESCAEGVPHACELLKAKGKKVPKKDKDDCNNGDSININQIQGITAPSFNSGELSMGQTIDTVFTTKSITTDNIPTNINYLIDKVEMARVHKIMYEDLASKPNIDPVKLAEFKKRLDDEVAEREFIIKEVTKGLSNYKDSLRKQINELVKDPSYTKDPTSYTLDAPNKTKTLQDYKDRIDEFKSNFNYYTVHENTFYLILGLRELSDEIKLLNDLIDNYINDMTPDINTNTKIELIRYLSNQITTQKNTFNLVIIKLDEKIKTLNETIESYQSIVEEINSYISEIPINELQQAMEELNKSYFSVKNAKGADPYILTERDAGGGFVPPPNQVGGQVSSTARYIKANPLATDKISKIKDLIKAKNQAKQGIKNTNNILNDNIKDPENCKTNGDFSFPKDTKELAKKFDVKEKDFHEKIKDAIRKDFSKEIKKELKGTSNPDIGFDKSGNIVLRNPKIKSSGTYSTGVHYSKYIP